MSERDSTSLIGELRRRKVVRPAVAYLAGAWIAIEVSDTVFPRLGLPDQAVTAVVWIAVLAFPVVVTLAWVYRLDAAGLRRETSTGDRAVPRGGRLLAGLLLALTVLLAFGAWRVWLSTGQGEGGSPDEGAPLDEGLVAVLPFHMAGATPELSTLRQGMIDLLATRLTGEVGPRAVDVRTVMSAWSRVAGSPEAELPQDSALRVAQMTGAATAVLGSVVVSGSRLTVTADVVPIAGGGAPTRVEAVGAADPDSLVPVLDRLAAQLISVQSGRDLSELGSMSVAVLPAWSVLRLYLSGEAAYRRGDYGAALADFGSALELDSTFAMAAFGVERSAPWTAGHEDDRERARRLAWRYRDRLSRLDRTHLIARLGPRYPAHPTARELLEARQDALDLLPDRAEVWYEMGDVYFHWGFVLAEPRALGRANDYLRRTLSLDEDYASALQHSIQLAGRAGDLATLHELAGRATAGEDSASDVGRYARWRLATVDADSAELDRFWSRPADLTDETMVLVVGDAVDTGLDVERILGAVRKLADLPGTRSERSLRLRHLHEVALVAGRPAEAAQALDELGAVLGRDVAARLAVKDALYADGDSARAEAGVAALLGREATDPVTDLRNRCVVAQWRLWHGQPVDDAPALAAELRSAAGEGRGIPGSLLAACAELVEALAAPPGPGRTAALDRLEALLLKGPLTALIETEHPYYANLALSRLREEAGDLEAALHAARRRPYFHGLIAERAIFFLTQGRLAARLGLREEAAEAYTRFLNLRSDPEPARRGGVERAKAALRGLVGEN